MQMNGMYASEMKKTDTCILHAKLSPKRQKQTVGIPPPPPFFFFKVRAWTGHGNLSTEWYTFVPWAAGEAESIGDEEEAAESWDGRQEGDGDWEWERPLVGGLFCSEQREENYPKLIFRLIGVTSWHNHALNDRRKEHGIRTLTAL